MNILITGAQFGNKGAQSLLFITVNELRKRYKSIAIYFLPIDWYRKETFESASKYKFIFVLDDGIVSDAFNAKVGIRIIKRTFLLNIMKRFANSEGAVLLSKTWDEIDAILDVSGYQLSSKFDDSSVYRNIRYFKKGIDRKIPIILLPQSFGPFDYKDSTIANLIAETLSEVNLVFAREMEGKEELEKIKTRNDIRLSMDIVVQSKTIDWNNIFVSEPTLEYLKISTIENVGIIPNCQTTIHGNEEEILALYKCIIEKLLKMGKEIYIFRHSDDLELCKKIYFMFSQEQHCHLIEDDMSCLEYEAFVRQFEFIIASRYHAIVHSYKENIPSIILGWAVKYMDLASSLGQEQYVFDISTDFIIEDILKSIDKINSSISNEKKIIHTHIKHIQENSCFDECWSILDRIDRGCSKKIR